MTEVFGNYIEESNSRNNETISVFDNLKYTKQKEGFYNKIKNNPNDVKSLKDFIGKQNQDKQKLGEYIKNLENKIHNETREDLDKQAMINEAKIMLYEKLGINDDLSKNSSVENFLKGVVDEMVLNNYDLAIQVYQTNGKIILDGLSQLTSWEGLKKIAETIGESIWTIWDGNAYEKGKATAELGLIGTGIGAGVYVGKKTLKLGMKQISKLRKPSERVVESAQAKNIIGETKKEVDDIVPKQELDFEKAVVEDIAKLGDRDRIEAGKFYLEKDITPKQQQAIIKAHNIGKDRDGAGIYNYNQAEILEKSRILKEAGFSIEERRILLEKGVCGKEKNIDGNIKIIDRQNLVEDLPRKDIELRKITEFPEINDKQLIQIEKELNNVILNIKYNSFEKIEKLFQLYKEKKGNGYSLIDAYNEIDFNHININKGSNCVGMAYILKDKLGKLGINSHLIRFDAGGLINDKYVVNGHSALIIPSTINGEKHFTLADPGMIISKTFTFADGKVSKPFILNGQKYVMHTEVKEGLPYMIDIVSKKKLYFDPYNEWINPGETLNKDIVRAIGDFKVVKQNPTGKPNAFITNLQKEEIKLKIGDFMEKISYKDFLEIKNNKNLYELFSGLVKDLGEDPDKFFNINKEIIEGAGEYKDKIWAPSTKKIVDLKNNNK